MTATPSARSDSAIHLWMVNQYATKPPSVGETRHYLLARSMRPLGVETTILAAESADNPRLADPSRRVRKETRIESTPDVTIAWLPARRYQGNGLGRIINMAGFAVTLLRRGLSPQRHGLTAPDIIVGSNPQPFASLAGWILSRRHRVPFVFEVRDLWPDSLVGILGVSRRHPLVLLFGAIEKFLYRHSAALVGVLNGVGTHARQRVGTAAPAFTWIPNGVALDTLEQPGPLRPPDEEFRVVYAGTHGPPNCMHTLLEAARELQEHPRPDDPKFRFDLYGDGISKPELVKYAQRHHLSSVRFHDPVPKDQVFGLLTEGDALVVLFRKLDLYRYGVSPNKLFDYLAAARPIVLALDSEHDPVTAAGAGLRANAEDATDVADKLRQLAHTPRDERATMGENGRLFAQKNHDMPVLAARYVDVLKGALGPVDASLTAPEN